jgi:uncharacterized protein YbcI
VSERHPHGAPELMSHGQPLLRQLSTEMVRMQKEAFGKGPMHSKAYMFDDLLMVVMRGGLTVAEKTMLEFGQADLVRNFRQQFENDMTSRMIEPIERLTGRKVLTYQSQVMFDPDVIVEIFVFDEAGGYEERFATAEGQMDDEPAGNGDTSGRG